MCTITVVSFVIPVLCMNMLCTIDRLQWLLSPHWCSDVKYTYVLLVCITCVMYIFPDVISGTSWILNHLTIPISLPSGVIVFGMTS